MRRLLALVALLSLLSGCGLYLTRPPLIQNKPAIPPEQSWTRVLSKWVDEQGRVDYEGLKAEPEDLKNFLSYIATFSPESDPDRFPSAADRLAYWINAYNAIAVYAVIDSHVKPEDRKRFYSRTKMVVGGKLMSLDDIEQAVAELKDARAFFALYGGAKGHPRLSTAAYTSAGLETELDQCTRAFLASSRNVQVDRARKVVRLSEIFRKHKSLYLARAASLLAYVNRFREDKVPEAYKVEFIPFDWSLHAQNPLKPENAQSK